MAAPVEYIKPSEPTVLGDNEFFEFTPIDFLAFPVDFVIVVPGAIDVEKFKDALSKTLAAHPVYGGRVVRPAKEGERWKASLKTAGVPLYLRESDQAQVVPLDTVCQSPLVLTTKVKPPAYFLPNSDEPLMTATLTRFTATGETAIGLSTSHSVGDAHTLLAFFRYLSNTYQGLDASEFTLSYAAHPAVSENAKYGDVTGARYTSPYDVFKLPPFVDPSVRELPVRVDFRVSAEQMQQLKKAVLAKHEGPAPPPRLSVQDCLVGAMVPALSRADSERPPIKRVVTFINHRGMGPTPADLAGNFIMEADTTPLAPTDDAYEVALKVRASYAVCKDADYVEANVFHCQRHAERLFGANQGGDLSPEDGDLDINSTRPFDYTAADFGYSGQACFYHTNLPSARYAKVFTPNPTRLPDGTWRSNKGGAEVTTYLQRDVAPRFERELSAELAAWGVEGEVYYPPVRA